MARSDVSHEELLRFVVDEVDQARDIYQLASQLAPLLPISSFDELVRAEQKTKLTFRDTPFDIESLRAHIPSIVFPVDDVRGLVERLGHLVRMVPPHLGVDTGTAEGARRQMRFAAQLAPGLGLIQTRGLTAIAIDPNAEPQSIPGGRAGGNQ